MRKVPETSDRISKERIESPEMDHQQPRQEGTLNSSTPEADNYTDPLVPQEENSRGKRKRREPIRNEDYVPYYIEETNGGVVVSGSTVNTENE